MCLEMHNSVDASVEFPPFIYGSWVATVENASGMELTRSYSAWKLGHAP